ALLLRRVAGTDGHRQLRLQAGQRSAQVALDVVVERLQRRDVEQAEPLSRFRGELVDPVEEGGERLSRAGWSLDQRVLAGRNRRPAERLRGRRRGERALEPSACFGAKRRERIHPPSLAFEVAPAGDLPDRLASADGVRLRRNRASREGRICQGLVELAV